MDLAYGDIPPPLPASKYDDGELREKASKLTTILDEANCLQHSVTTMVENLQKNPDALAAVALTLAEISTMVGKMGPSVLPLLKGSFPAVAALLISPQFMIAGGVAIGVTIVGAAFRLVPGASDVLHIDPDSVYHLGQIAGMVLLARAVARGRPRDDVVVPVPSNRAAVDGR